MYCNRRAEQIVIAGELEHGHGQRREQLVGARVLGRVARVRDVAGDQHRDRRRAQRQDAFDGGGERRLRRVVVEPDVRIADLGEKKH